MTRHGKATTLPVAGDAVDAEVERLYSARRTLEEKLATIESELRVLLRANRRAVGRALRQLSLEGDIDAVNKCLAARADVNSRSRGGTTPLLSAVYRDGNQAVVELLLAAGADPNRADLSGTTPLIAAVRPGQLPAVRVLVEHGATIDAHNRDGDTPLTNAAIWGAGDVVAFLLAAGADPSLPDGIGATAAGMARQHGYVEIAAAIDRAVGTNLGEACQPS